MLAHLRDYRCHSGAETIEKALTGNYRAEHLFALEQALSLYKSWSQCRSVAVATSAPARACTGKRLGRTSMSARRFFELLGKDLT